MERGNDLSRTEHEQTKSDDEARDDAVGSSPTSFDGSRKYERQNWEDTRRDDQRQSFYTGQTDFEKIHNAIFLEHISARHQLLSQRDWVDSTADAAPPAVRAGRGLPCGNRAPRG